MRDYLAWRMAFGITTPSVNTVVQPEYDDMRPAGVTNHLARMHMPQMAVHTDADFETMIGHIDAGLDEAVDRVMSCQPNHLILGISALAVWGGSTAASEAMKARIRARAGGTIGVTMSSDAVIAALRAYGVKRRIAIMEPYYPVIEPRLNGFLGEYGYEIVRFLHMRGKKPESYSVLRAQDMIAALREIDGDDIEAIVQFGANLPMARIADEAERWLDKPVISINVATYWHALRMNGIEDKVQGFGTLLSHH